MNNIKDYLLGDGPILEMATISKSENWGSEHYRIAVHGPASGDRLVPHVHIYLTSDKKPYNQFNFEVSLIDILCYDEINLIYQRDTKNNILRSNRNKCSWEGYRKIKNGFEDWLFSKSSTPGDFKDNLDAIIYWWNEESDTITLKEYINSKGLKILDKYLIYFN